MLAERSALWNAKPESRYLPSLMEWLGIRTLTDSKHWTGQQREMMNRAGRLHSLRSIIALATLLAIISVGIVVRGQVLQRQEATRIEGLVKQLVSADPNQIPTIIRQLAANHAVAAGYLSPLVSKDVQTVDEKRARLHARLATVSHDRSLVEPLLDELLADNVAYTYLASIREQLRPYAGELTDKLRDILRDEKAGSNRRFRAAVALADYVPLEADSWTQQDLQFVASQLVLENPDFQSILRENLRPISERLLADFEKIFVDSKSTDAQRLSAANAFAGLRGKRHCQIVPLVDRSNSATVCSSISIGRRQSFTFDR